jgi:hypothetical protein
MKEKPSFSILPDLSPETRMTIPPKTKDRYVLPFAPGYKKILADRTIVHRSG